MSANRVVAGLSVPVRAAIIAALFAPISAGGPTGASIAGAAEQQIAGRVVDENDRPVSGADIGYYWTADLGNTTDGFPLPARWALSHSDGSFSATIPVREKPVVLMALDDRRERAGLAVLDKSNTGRPVVIRLLPLVTIRGSFISKQTGKRPRSSLAEITLLPQEIDIALCTSDLASFVFQLPPGRYRLRGNSGDMLDVHREFTLTGEERTVGLGDLEMQPNPRARLYGKPAPDWHATEIRGLDADASVSDLKGKWLLLEFWGVWCAPCVAHELPNLMRFYEKHREQRDRFEIVAIHCREVETLQEMDEKLTQVREKFWNGKSLPFPVVLDATETTVTAYGVDSFPTTVLIDPQGRVVRDGSVAMLDAILAGEFDPDESIEPPQPPVASPKSADYRKTDICRKLPGNANQVTSVAYSPDGSLLAAGASDYRINIWNSETGERVRTIPAGSQRLIAGSSAPPVAFLPGGDRLATLFTDFKRTADELKLSQRVELYRVTDGERFKSRLPEIDGQSSVLVISGDGRVVALAFYVQKTQDSCIRVWELEDGKLQCSIDGLPGIQSLRLSADGRRLVLGTFAARPSQPRIELWDVSSRAKLWSVEQPGFSITGIAFSPDGRTLATTSWHESIHLRDAETGAVRHTLRVPGHRAYSAAFSPDGRFLATGGTNPFTTVRLWDLTTRDLQATLIGHTGTAVHAVAFAPGGSELATVGGWFDGSSPGDPGEVFVWDVDEILKHR